MPARLTQPHDLLIGFLLVQSLMERRSESFFQPFGLTGAQFNILNLLAKSSGRMDQAALADMLLVGKSSISIVLTRMVKAGLLGREEHPKDRRQTVLSITKKGHSLWKKISPIYEKNVEAIFGEIPQARRGKLLQDLKTLHDVLTPDASAKDEWLNRFLDGNDKA